MSESTPQFLPRFLYTKSHLPPFPRSKEHSSDQRQRCQYCTGWLSCRSAHANRAAAFPSSRRGLFRHRHFCTPDFFRNRYTVFCVTSRPHSTTNSLAVIFGFVAIVRKIRLPWRSSIEIGLPERGREMHEVWKRARLAID